LIGYILIQGTQGIIDNSTINREMIMLLFGECCLYKEEVCCHRHNDCNTSYSSCVHINCSQ